MLEAGGYHKLPERADNERADAGPANSRDPVGLGTSSPEFSLPPENTFLVEDTLPDSGKSDLKNAFFNMSNSIIGAGIIGIPRAMKNAGLLTGILLLIVLTWLNDWTLRLIIVNTKLSGTRTYTAFVHHAYGDFGKTIVLLAQGLFGFGGSIGFSVIIGDTIPHVFRSIFQSQVQDYKPVDFLLSRNVLIFVCVMGISYPLSLTRDISRLAKASGLALVSMMAILVIVVMRGPAMPESLRGEIVGADWLFKTSIFQSISVISFALVCHHNTTFIYDSIRTPTLDRFNKVTHVACVVSGIVCGVMGICGYLTFGSKTKGNILNNFPSEDWIVNIARLCFGLNMLTTFPLEVFVVRAVVMDLIIIYKRREDPSYHQDELSNRQHFIVTTILCALPMIVSLFTCNLGAILELVGATSASLLAYILPPLCLMRLTKGQTVGEKVACWVCVGFGFSVMVLSSLQTILSAIKEGGGHCVE